MNTSYRRLKQRRDTAANWQTNNPVLLAGEIGIEIDTRRLKIGDGAARWNEIPYSGYTAEEAADMVREIAYTKQQVNDMIDGVAETIPTKTSDLTNDSGFTTFSGSYNDLTDKPSLFSGRYEDLSGKPELFSGSYNDLTDKPTIPSVGDGTITIVQGNAVKGTFSTNQSGNTTITIDAGGEFSQQQADWAQTDTTQADFIKNKPELFSGSYNDLTDKPALFSGSYTDLTNKPTIPTKTSELTNDSGFSTFSGSYNDLADKPSLFSGSYNDLSDKPTIPTKTSDLTNDSGFTTFSGSYNDLTNKPTIPTKTSELTNDSGFTTFSGSYTDLTDKPSLSTVATSGSYEDLTNKPTIPAAQVNSDWNAGTGVAQILNKPNIPTKTSELTNDSGFTTFSGDYNDLSNTPEFALVATTGKYEDLEDKPEIPSVGDATITVNVNNTPKTSFTTNQRINGSIDLTIPTKTSDLTNDSGFTTFSGRYNDLSGKPTLFSGDYLDLTNKPTIPAAQVNSDWNATSGVAQILNKPTVPSGMTTETFTFELEDGTTVTKTIVITQ